MTRGEQTASRPQKLSSRYRGQGNGSVVEKRADDGHAPSATAQSVRTRCVSLALASVKAAAGQFRILVQIPMGDTVAYQKAFGLATVAYHTVAYHTVAYLSKNEVR